MVIYGDIVFLENFIVDYFLLNVTGKILMIKTKKSRLLVASFIGALYTFTFLIPKLKILSIFPVQFLIAFIILSISLNIKNIFLLFKGTICFIIISALLSGTCILLLLIKSNSIFGDNILSNNTIKNIIIGVISIYFFCCYMVKFTKNKAIVTNFKYDVNLEVNSKEYNIKAFLDTGNELYEPASNLPCIIVEDWIFKDIQLSKDNIYYVPYRAVGIKGQLIGFKANWIRIKNENSKWEEIEALICLCQENLSRDNDFNALLSRGII